MLSELEIPALKSGRKVQVCNWMLASWRALKLNMSEEKTPPQVYWDHQEVWVSLLALSPPDLSLYIPDKRSNQGVRGTELNGQIVLSKLSL